MSIPRPGLKRQVVAFAARLVITLNFSPVPTAATKVSHAKLSPANGPIADQRFCRHRGPKVSRGKPVCYPDLLGAESPSTRRLGQRFGRPPGKPLARHHAREKGGETTAIGRSHAVGRLWVVSRHPGVVRKLVESRHWVSRRPQTLGPVSGGDIKKSAEPHEIVPGFEAMA
jgi:hypothetical protein